MPDEKSPAPANSLLAQILANANASTAKHAPVKAAVETKVCASCGAARPEDTDLKRCDYCGHEF